MNLYYYTECDKGTWLFLNCVMLATPEDNAARTMSFASLTDVVAVVMEQWRRQHCAFIVETFLENCDFFKLQRIFRKHFNISCHGKVPCRNTMQLWIKNFITSASALKKEQPGSVCRVRSPQNIEAVRQSFVRSPRCSARRHSVDLEISDCSVRRVPSLTKWWWCNSYVIVTW
jgi:hypothetical protein